MSLTKCDRIVVVGVGGVVESLGDEDEVKNFFKIATKCLKPGGKILIQTTTSGVDEEEKFIADDWMKTNGYFKLNLTSPPLKTLFSTTEELGLSTASVADVTLDYQRTVTAWKKQFHKIVEVGSSAGVCCGDNKVNDDEQVDILAQLTQEYKSAWKFTFAYVCALFNQRKISAHEIVYSYSEAK
jgi:hypothetical protein